MTVRTTGPLAQIDLRNYLTGDGVTDETTKLQTAVTAAAGRILFCHPSLTVIYSSPITVLSDTKIYGGGAFKQKTANAVTTYPQAAFTCVDGSGVIFDGITIDGNYNASNAGALKNGVFFRTVTNSVVRNCTLLGVEQVGIYLQSGSSDNVIENNYVEGRPGLGSSDANQLIHLASDIYGTNGTNGLKDEDGTVDFSRADALAATVIRNVVRGNICVYGTHGVSLFNASHNTVVGNVCRENAHRGVILSPTSDYNAITGNVIDRAASSGIHFAYGSRYNTVTGNSISGTTGGEGDGIKGYYDCCDNLISGNSVVGCYKSGIRFAVKAERNVITANFVANCGVSASSGAGITLEGQLPTASGYTTPTGTQFTQHNVVLGNVVASCYKGIDLRDGGETTSEIKRNLVANNIVNAASTYGIHGDTSNFVYDNFLHGNHVQSSNTANYSYGANVFRYYEFLNSDAAAQYPTMTGFKLKNIAGQDARVITTGTAAPVSGTWVRGDRVFDTAPSAGGTEGWVCVTGGTPGTWKAFGSIAA